MDDYRTLYRHMLVCENKTEHTITSYCSAIDQFLKYYETVLHKDPKDFTWQEIRDYTLYLSNECGLADSTINQAIAKIEHLVIYVLHEHWDPTQVPKRVCEILLPTVPSHDQCIKLINHITDPKYHVMVVLMYSAGLRCCEVCRLRYGDIRKSEHRIYISVSKNRSDRFAILSDKALEDLINYWRSLGSPSVSPKDYLFPQRKDHSKCVTTAGVQAYVRKAADEIGLTHVTCHSLRHAFGTEMYLANPDLIRLKELMGHKSISSTCIYVTLAHQHFDDVVSPYDMKESK